MNEQSHAKFWWGVSFLCNLVAVWFIQPLLALFYRSGVLSSAPAAIVELEASIPPMLDSATTMAEILCLVALMIGIASASKAASMAG